MHGRLFICLLYTDIKTLARNQIFEARKTYNCRSVFQHQNPGLKPGIWCMEDCSYVWLYTDTKTLARNQIFDERKTYNCRTVAQHQNPGLKPCLWCMEDCSYVWLYTDIKTLAWNHIFDASKTYYFRTEAQHQNPGLKPGFWCMEDIWTVCSYVWLYNDIKCLAWNQIFDARKTYNCLTVVQHQNPGLKPGLWDKMAVQLS